jgi:diacylglycerol kinase family enzyme
MDTRRAIIIANPTAGSGAGRINRVRLLEVAQRELERGDLKIELATATDAADVSNLAEQAARDRIPIVIAAGGDGTINAVANGLMRVAHEQAQRGQAQRGQAQATPFIETPPKTPRGRRKSDNIVAPSDNIVAPSDNIVAPSDNETSRKNESLSGTGATGLATSEIAAPRVEERPISSTPFIKGDLDDYALPTLGVLPMGTGNVLAFNLGIATSLREACRVIRHGHTRRIDIGFARALGGALPSAHLVNVANASATNAVATSANATSANATSANATSANATSSNATSAKATSLDEQGATTAAVAPLERHFLLMAGVGFDAKVMEDTSLRLKYVLRDFAYVISTLQNVILHKGTRTSLRFDEGGAHLEEAWLLMIGNAASYAWDIKFTSHARLDDGVLDVCLLPWENKLVSIQQAIQVLTGQHIESGTARYWKTKGLRIECEPPVPVQLDGDEWARTPLEVSVFPGALRVLVPREGD